MDARIQNDLGLQRIRAIAVSAGNLAEKLMARRVGISVAEARVLRALHDFPSSTASEIAARILLTPVQVGRCVARLKKMALLSVEPHILDGRAMHLELTPRGLQAHVVASEVTSAVQAWTIRDLTANEWSSLDAILTKLERSTNYSEADVKSLVSTMTARPITAAGPKRRANQVG